MNSASCSWPPSWSPATGCLAATAAAIPPGLSFDSCLCKKLDLLSGGPGSSICSRPAQKLRKQPAHGKYCTGGTGCQAQGGRYWCSEMENGELGQFPLLLETPLLPSSKPITLGHQLALLAEWGGQRLLSLFVCLVNGDWPFVRVGVCCRLEI